MKEKNAAFAPSFSNTKYRLFPQTSSLKVRVEQEESGAVAAEVSWEGGDLFRLAGIKKTQASRKAAYAWDR